MTIRAFVSPSLYRLKDIVDDASAYSGGLLMTYRYSSSTRSLPYTVRCFGRIPFKGPPVPQQQRR